MSTGEKSVFLYAEKCLRFELNKTDPPPPPLRREAGKVLVLTILHTTARHYSYLCTYDLYSPVHNVFDACISITRAKLKKPRQTPSCPMQRRQDTLAGANILCCMDIKSYHLITGGLKNQTFRPLGSQSYELRFRDGWLSWNLGDGWLGWEMVGYVER